jgi:F0F1-type ATP synthase delta subunit
LAKTLQDKLRKKITVENKVKPEILGGLIVRYEGMVADGSLLSALEKVAAGMKTLKFGSQLVHEN